MPDPMMTTSTLRGNALPSDEIDDFGTVQNGRVGLGTGRPGDDLIRLDNVSSVLLRKMPAATISLALDSTVPMF